MSKQYTLAEIKAHQTKKDLWVVIHDKVYSCGNFVDEHPGGEEVLMDVAGLDATHAFEDVGHSDEAREILKGLLVGTLKRTASDPKPSPVISSPPNQKTTDAGVAIYAFVLCAAAVAYGAYTFYA